MMKNADIEKKLKAALEYFFASKGEEISEIIFEEVFKSGVKRQAVTIKRKEASICPTIYIEPELRKLGILENREIATPEDYLFIAKQIANIWEESMKNAPVFATDLKGIFSLDYIKDNLFLQVVNTDYREYLKDKIYKQFCNLAFIPAIKVKMNDENKENETASIVITKPLLNHIGVEEEIIFKLAERSCEEYDIYSMNDIIRELMPFVETMPFPITAPIPMYVISNDVKIFGASVLAFPEKLSELLKSKNLETVFVLPSSKHEIIVMPFEERAGDASYLRNMVRDINMTEIPEKDFLSNEVYFFDVNEKILKIVK